MPIPSFTSVPGLTGPQLGQLSTECYIGLSGGCPTGLTTSTLAVPGQQGASLGIPFNAPAANLSVVLPSLTLMTATGTGGALSVVNNNTIRQATQLYATIYNGSGSSINSGSFTVNGYDSHYPTTSASETWQYTLTQSIANGGTLTIGLGTAIGPIFGPGPGGNAGLSMVATGHLEDSGVVTTITEGKFRYWLKIPATAPSTFVQDWNNEFAEGDLRVCMYDVLSTGISNIQDYRDVGNISPRQRMSSEIVPWLSYTYRGLSEPGWQSLCVYGACETADNWIVVTGNQCPLSIFDGQRFIGTYSLATMSGLVVASKDNAYAIYCIQANENPYNHDIIFIGTGLPTGGASTGKLIRWDFTAWRNAGMPADSSASSYFTLTSTLNQDINRIVRGQNPITLFVLGSSNMTILCQENGTSASINDYKPFLFQTATYGIPYGVSTSDEVMDGQYYDKWFYVVGGFAGGYMRLAKFNTDTQGPGIEYTQFLPGTAAQNGRTSAIASVGWSGITAKPDGKLILVGSCPGFAMIEWDTRQVYTEAECAFTVNAATKIPIGTIISNGSQMAVTITSGQSTGSGTIYTRCRSLTPGDAGLALINTFTTLVSNVPTCTAVTNNEAFGFGRCVGSVRNNASYDDFPYGLIESQPNDIKWGTKDALIATQGGDLITWDTNNYKTLAKNPSFSRANFVYNYSFARIVGWDDGTLVSVPY